MKIVVAVLLGFFSGVMAFLMVGRLLLPPINQRTDLESLVGLVVLPGAWLLSTLWMLRATTIQNALCRGFLLGAAEWLLMIPVAVFEFSRPTLVDQQIGDDVKTAKALLVFVGVLACVGAMILCLVAYALTNAWRKKSDS